MTSICTGADTVNSRTAKLVGKESLLVGKDVVDTVIVTATDVAGKNQAVSPRSLSGFAHQTDSS